MGTIVLKLGLLLAMIILTVVSGLTPIWVSNCWTWCISVCCFSYSESCENEPQWHRRSDNKSTHRWCYAFLLAFPAAFSWPLASCICFPSWPIIWTTCATSMDLNSTIRWPNCSLVLASLLYSSWKNLYSTWHRQWLMDIITLTVIRTTTKLNNCTSKLTV